MRNMPVNRSSTGTYVRVYDGNGNDIFNLLVVFYGWSSKHCLPGWVSEFVPRRVAPSAVENRVCHRFEVGVVVDIHVRVFIVVGGCKVSHLDSSGLKP